MPSLRHCDSIRKATDTETSHGLALGQLDLACRGGRLHRDAVFCHGGQRHGHDNREPGTGGRECERSRPEQFSGSCSPWVSPAAAHSKQHAMAAESRNFYNENLRHRRKIMSKHEQHAGHAATAAGKANDCCSGTHDHEETGRNEQGKKPPAPSSKHDSHAASDSCGCGGKHK
jgi:hypothetical protein